MLFERSEERGGAVRPLAHRAFFLNLLLSRSTIPCKRGACKHGSTHAALPEAERLASPSAQWPSVSYLFFEKQCSRYRMGQAPSAFPSQDSQGFPGRLWVPS